MSLVTEHVLRYRMLARIILIEHIIKDVDFDVSQPSQAYHAYQPYHLLPSPPPHVWPPRIAPWCHPSQRTPSWTRRENKRWAYYSPSRGQVSRIGVGLAQCAVFFLGSQLSQGKSRTKQKQHHLRNLPREQGTGSAP